MNRLGHSIGPDLVRLESRLHCFRTIFWRYLLVANTKLDTFPMLALKNEALLHAILAIASLHIAKLQRTHVTASLKHYAIALRRIAKIVSIPGRREHPVVLATTLLLCFYECWCADHQKWSGHLLGVRSL